MELIFFRKCDRRIHCIVYHYSVVENYRNKSHCERLYKVTAIFGGKIQINVWTLWPPRSLEVKNRKTPILLIFSHFFSISLLHCVTLSDRPFSSSFSILFPMWVIKLLLPFSFAKRKLRRLFLLCSEMVVEVQGVPIIYGTSRLRTPFTQFWKMT